MKVRSWAAKLMVFAILLANYVLSYLLLVTPGHYTVRARLPDPYDRSDYRGGQPYVSYIFWPLEQIDRALRPEQWKVPNARGGW